MNMSTYDMIVEEGRKIGSEKDRKIVKRKQQSIKSFLLELLYKKNT